MRTPIRHQQRCARYRRTFIEGGTFPPTRLASSGSHNRPSSRCPGRMIHAGATLEPGEICSSRCYARAADPDVEVEPIRASSRPHGSCRRAGRPGLLGPAARPTAVPRPTVSRRVASATPTEDPAAQSGRPPAAPGGVGQMRVVGHRRGKVISGAARPARRTDDDRIPRIGIDGTPRARGRHGQRRAAGAIFAIASAPGNARDLTPAGAGCGTRRGTPPDGSQKPPWNGVEVGYPAEAGREQEMATA